MSRFVIIFILAVAICAAATGQPVKTFSPSAPENAGFSAERLKRIDLLLETYVREGQTPGAVALVIRNGKVVYHKAFGYRNTSTRDPLKKEDIFRIASQTKAITSTAAMMLWEEGKFLLDDPVSRYIPEFRSPKVLKTFDASDTSFTTEPAAREITIRDLLTHSSGIDYAVIGSPDFKAIYAKYNIPSGIGNDSDVIGTRMKALGSLPLKHQPGEQWTYGLNHDVLGYLVEIWSGMTFDEFLKTRIFDPLGMKDTYFYLPKDKHGRLVALHEFIDGKPVPIKTGAYDALDPNYPTLKGTYLSGGAGLSSTVEDYARFLQLFLNKGEFNGVRLLSRKTVELILTDQLPHLNNEYGLAFGLETKKNDHASVVSEGSFSWGGAFSTSYWADPKENLIGIIYTNVFGNPYWQLSEKFKTLTYQAIMD